MEPRAFNEHGQKQLWGTWGRQRQQDLAVGVEGREMQDSEMMWVWSVGGWGKLVPSAKQMENI